MDANDAGEGTMEIGITSPSGQNIHNNVVPTGAGKFEVSNIPQEAGQYKITVTFNKENVPGLFILSGCNITYGNNTTNLLLT